MVMMRIIIIKQIEEKKDINKEENMINQKKK